MMVSGHLLSTALVCLVYVSALPYDNKQSLVASNDVVGQLYDGDEQYDAEFHYMDNGDDDGPDEESSGREASEASGEQAVESSGEVEEGSGGTPGEGEEIDYSRDNQKNGIKAKGKAKGDEVKKTDKHHVHLNGKVESKAANVKVKNEMKQTKSTQKKKNEGKRKHYNAISKKIRKKVVKEENKEWKTITNEMKEVKKMKEKKNKKKQQADAKQSN